MNDETDKVVRLRARPALRAVPPPPGPAEGDPFRLFYCVGDDSADLFAAEDLGEQQWRFWEPDPEDGTPDNTAEFLIAPGVPLDVALAALDQIRLALIADYSPDPKSAA